jgi:peptide-methionine (S)-S-oxide reductase
MLKFTLASTRAANERGSLERLCYMSLYLSRILVAFFLGASLACNAAAADDAVVIPDPAVDAPLATAKGKSTVVLAGGCFWGVEAVFEHVKGVTNVVSGYSGGTAKTASYDAVSAGQTEHAEAVRITYDPSQITYGRLLKIFFAVAHDPTQLNRQGPDVGKQYRSAIFYADAEQKRIADGYINQLNQAKVFKRQIVTQVVALNSFYQAEAYHQDYAAHHPEQPYIVSHDLPKVDKLRKHFPDLYVAKSLK